jgi:hypothetical protein
MNVLRRLKVAQIENRSTKIYVVIQGVVGGLAGMIHGFAEISQGNRPTGGQWLVSVGAFTLIPNYLATGMAAVLVGLCVLVWTLGFIQTKHGATIFLILATVLFLVGGGVAQVLFYLIAWGVATQIRQPLSWWRKALSETRKKQLAKGWRLNFAAGYFFFFIAIAIWLVLTPPGAKYKDPLSQYVLWMCLFISILFQVLTIVSGFARDILRQDGQGL